MMMCPFKVGDVVVYKGYSTVYVVAEVATLGTDIYNVTIVRNTSRYKAVITRLEVAGPELLRRHHDLIAATMLIISRRERKQQEAAAIRAQANQTPSVPAILRRFGITKIVYNTPATIVYFNDGTKEVVKISATDTFDYKTGVLMCLLKKLTSSEDNYKLLKKNLFRNIEKYSYEHLLKGGK